MSATDTGVTKAREVFTEHGGMLRTSKALRLGIHPRTLYALRDAGEIEQVGRGLYRLSTAPALSSPDLVPIAIRIPRTVVCLISASSRTMDCGHSRKLSARGKGTVCQFQFVYMFCTNGLRFLRTRCFLRLWFQ